MELVVTTLVFHVVFFFFFFLNESQMNPRINRVWETQFWVGTQVSQTRVPKTVHLTKLFHLHTILLIFFQKYAVQQILPHLVHW